MKNWIIIALVLSLALNAMIVGYFVSKPVRHAIPRMPFPPAPPGIPNEIVPELRDHFFQSRDSLRDDMRQLRMDLAREIASKNSNKVLVDSLLDAISDEQRTLQETIIAYIDSLKEIIPEEDLPQLQDWIMHHFGHIRSNERGHRRPPRRSEAPMPEAPPQSE